MNINTNSVAASSGQNGSVESFMPLSSSQVKVNSAQTAIQADHKNLKSDLLNDKENPLSKENAKMLAQELNELMDDFQTNLGFSIYEDLNNQVIVEIKNRQTDELIKQIPSEEMLTIREKMEELTGMLFNGEA